MSAAVRIQIGLLTLTRVAFNTAYRMVYPFLPFFVAGLGVDVATLSLVFTARSIMAAVGPLLAGFTDRYGRRTGLLLGVGIFVTGLVAGALLRNLLGFTIAVLFVMVGKTLFEPSMLAYVGDQVEYGKRSLAIAISETGWSLSAVIGLPLISVLIAAAGWWAPFPVLAAIGGLIFVVLYRMIPDGRSAAADSSLLKNLRLVFGHPTAFAGLLFGFTLAAGNEFVNLMFGVWMDDAFAVQIAALGGAALLIGISELSGEGLVALFTDRLGKPRAVALGLAANSLAALALPVLGGSLGGAYVALFLFYLTFEFALVSSLPLVSELLPEARATMLATYAALISLGRALGALLAPAVYALGIAASGSATAGMNLVALVALILLVRAFARTRQNPV